MRAEALRIGQRVELSRRQPNILAQLDRARLVPSGADARVFRAIPKGEHQNMQIRAKCPDLIPVKSVYSVKEFCCQFGISRALFYRLLQEGKGPRIIKAGKRTLITNEAAEAWKRSMERAA